MLDGDVHHQQATEMGIADLDLKNLKVISALGRGAKGVVFLVQKQTGELLALKCILRSSIEKKSYPINDKANGDGSEYRRISFERQVLSSFQHPLLPKLHGVVSTDKIVGYAIDYCSGGDFNALRKKQTEKMFSDDIIRFYAAELVLALEYLHGLGIVYRDLKPENVMIQENGHLMLVDFDLSTKLSPKTPSSESAQQANREPKMTMKKKKKLLEFYKCCSSGILPSDSVHPAERDSVVSESDSVVEKSNSFVGTEEYVAPEIIIGNGHDFAVDWWCLGVMMYEMLYGKTPFKGSNRKETFHRILTKEAELTGEPTPLRDLIRKLLEKDPKNRVSVDEIKKHEFFKEVDWDFLVELPRPPFIPPRCEINEKSAEIKERILDVENFVQGVFKGKEGGDDDDDDVRVENCKVVEETKNDKNDEGCKDGNNGVWVQGLNHPTQAQNDNFLIF